MPTFDVVVPCYNYARFLERCVKSALNQEGADVRVLIIDDCSSDDSALVGQKLAHDDPRVEFRRHEKNQGHIATYNEGLIGWAKADYCLLLSADDALAPGAFQRALKLFETSDDIGLVYGLARVIFHDDSQFAFPCQAESSHVMSGNDFIKYCCESCFNPVTTPTAIVRTSWQQRLGGYRSDLPHTGDLEMWMRFARNGSVGIVRFVQGEYRWHGQNMGTQYYNRILSDRHEFELTCLDVVRPMLDKNPKAHVWLQSMYAQLLREAQSHELTAFDSGDLKAHNAWHSFAQTLSEHVTDPRPPLRLVVRRFLGPNIWRLLRRARGAANPGLLYPQNLNTAWSPSHGEIIGGPAA